MGAMEVYQAKGQQKDDQPAGVGVLPLHHLEVEQKMDLVIPAKREKCPLLKQSLGSLFLFFLKAENGPEKGENAH